MKAIRALFSFFENASFSRGPSPQRLKLLLEGAMPSADSTSQAFRRACNRLHAVDLRFNDLRHEAVSRMFEQGFSVPKVAAISGHEDFRMLARYTHVDSTGGN